MNFFFPTNKQLDVSKLLGKFLMFSTLILLIQTVAFSLAPIWVGSENPEKYFESLALKLLEDETQTDFSLSSLRILSEILNYCDDRQFTLCITELLKKNLSNGIILVKSLIEISIDKKRWQYISLLLNESNGQRKNMNNSFFFSENFPLKSILDHISWRLMSGTYRPDKPFVIVSLGASRMQEIYSILMGVSNDSILNPDRWPEKPLSFIECIAIEKDEHVLNEGMEGVYTATDVMLIRHLPDLMRFFTPVGKKFRIDPDLTNRILPVVSSIQDVETIPNSDLILFNRVSYYLNEADRWRVSAKIAKSSQPNSLLFTTAPARYFHQNFDVVLKSPEGPGLLLNLKNESIQLGNVVSVNTKYSA